MALELALPFRWLAACVAVLGCSDGRPKPYWPEDDLAWLVKDYEAPSGELRLDEVDRALESAAPLLRGLWFADHLAFVMNAVREAANGYRGPDLNVTAEVNLSGRVDAHLTCPGASSEGAAGPPSTAAGRVDIALPVVDSKLGPAGEGHAVSCSFDVADVPLPPWLERESGAVDQRSVTLDGALGVHLGAVLSLDEEITVRPMVRIVGTLNVEGLPELSGVDFRSPDPQTLEVRVTAPTGAVVVFSDGVALGIRERRGIWSCVTARGDSCMPSF